MVRSSGSICESQEGPTSHIILKDCCETGENGSDLTVEDNFQVHMINDRFRKSKLLVKVTIEKSHTHWVLEGTKRNITSGHCHGGPGFG